VARTSQTENETAPGIRVAVQKAIVFRQGTASEVVPNQDIENRISALSEVERVDDQIITANE
jgi:hypothetical protein